jgi:hypothetical protein
MQRIAFVELKRKYFSGGPMRSTIIFSMSAALFGAICAQAPATVQPPPLLERSSTTARATAPPAESTKIDACDAGLPKTIVGQVTLPARCVYSRELLITHSHTLLDCKGAVFDGHGTMEVGLNIDSGGKPLWDVTVRNCTFQNYVTHGVLIGWSGLDASKPQKRGFLYSHTPHDIHLDHITITHIGHVGLYVDDYVQKVLIDHAAVRGSGAPGIYFEHSSREITLRDSVVSGNGGARREGLSIDSSAHDIVEGNTFENDKAGGVFLYRNCWEHADDPSQGSVYRWQHSDFNIIRNNIFLDEPIGVWIASRQSEDLTRQHCGDTPMGGDARYYRDYADANIVEGNRYCNVKVPVIVEGDRNIIRGNGFDRTNKIEVEMPVTKREQLLHLPSTGNVISGSKEITCSK